MEKDGIKLTVATSAETARDRGDVAARVRAATLEKLREGLAFTLNDLPPAESPAEGRRSARRNPALLVVFVPLLVVGVALLSAIGYVIAIAADTLPVRASAARQGRDLQVYAADGSRLGYVRSDEIRTPIPWSEMPRTSRGHHRDRGRALLRARGRGLLGDHPCRRQEPRIGGCRAGRLDRSLSSSCARLHREPERNFERKIRAKLAQELEDEHPGRAGKNWILREYLNSVPYGTNEGRTSIGIEAAPRPTTRSRPRTSTSPSRR